MRLDKYLKVSRLIKRRTLAKEASEADRILVNNLPAKPAKDIKVGDTITIQYGRKLVTVKVTSLAESIRKEDAALMYDLISEMNKE